MEGALPAFSWVLRFLLLISSVGLFYLIKQKAPEIESFPWLTGQAQRCTSSAVCCLIAPKKKKNPNHPLAPIKWQQIANGQCQCFISMGGKASRGSRRDLCRCALHLGDVQLPARLRVPGKTSISPRKDDGRESGGSRLLWAPNKENSQNIQAFSQVKVLVGETPAAEEAKRGGLAG